MDNCMIKYNITEDDLFKKINAASLTEMTDSLRKAGFHLLVEDGMMQSLKDKEIAEKINMPIATYYRHKKRLTSSAYYTALDQNKLDDMQYLQSVSGNLLF